jgi:uncharacterized protein (DUF952 family)
MHLFHLVGRDEWALAAAAATYAPASLALEGFIHFSTAEQLAGSAARFFAGRGDLVVVAVDPERLAAPLRFDPVGGEAFPHLYGPLNLEAVIDVTPWAPPRGPLSG